ncbi:galactonate oxidoreductase [Alginatibacterium sediminis]|uniref:Galactonate oxidoreductase n=1 Tax=Alginatibacterium sediminis TaxID=2164068 RepID=A0A420EB87_9ALTE|nr:alcohol dehydrogenase catalytic domain-containing protein [Alginatibacterium sediminis]RKF17948.1 galactonate oxidoreductase [Alginatibacterium sediminis]
MKSLVCEKPFEIAYKEVSIPTIGIDQALIKVKAVGICGTDIHAYAGRQPFFSYPRVLGHEICGVVETVNSASKLKTGQQVVVVPCVACGKCSACMEGKTNCCEDVSLYGVHQDGGFQEFLAVNETNLIPVPASISPSASSLIECFAIGAHANARAQTAKQQNVLVVGAGPIGIGAAAIAKARGANVVVADIAESRREHISAQLDIPAIDPTSENYIESLRSHFNGELACTVLDASGNKQSMTNSVNLIRHGGKIVFIGLYIGDLQLDDPTFHKKETTLIASRNATSDDFDMVIKYFEDGALSESMMLNQTFDFATVGLDYEQSVVNNKTLIKGVIQFS